MVWRRELGATLAVLFAIVHCACSDNDVSADAGASADAGSPADATAAADAPIIDASSPDSAAPDASEPDATLVAALEVSPPSVDYGVVCEAGAADAWFTVTNTGDLAVGPLVTSIAGVDAADFSIVTDSCAGASLAPGITCDVEVRLAPRIGVVGGGLSASLHVEQVGGPSTMAAVGGDVIACDDIAVLMPTPYDFGSVDVGSAGSATFTLQNVGATTKVPMTSVISGQDPGDFHIQSDGCVGFLLVGGDSCTVTVEFRPTAVGARSAVLSATTVPGITSSCLLLGTGADSTP